MVEFSHSITATTLYPQYTNSYKPAILTLDNRYLYLVLRQRFSTIFTIENKGTLNYNGTLASLKLRSNFKTTGRWKKEAIQRDEPPQNIRQDNQIISGERLGLRWPPPWF